MDESTGLCAHCKEPLDQNESAEGVRLCRWCLRFGVSEEMPHEFRASSFAIRMWPFQQVWRDLRQIASEADLELKVDAGDLAVQWASQDRICHFTKEPLSYLELMLRARDGLDLDSVELNPREPLVFRLDPMRGFVRHNIVWIVRGAFQTMKMLVHQHEACRKSTSHG